MDLIAVRHEAGRQCDDGGAGRFAKELAVRFDVLSGVRIVSVPFDERADVSEAAVETSIEVDEDN
jgi:hypothetical protein